MSPNQEPSSEKAKWRTKAGWQLLLLLIIVCFYWKLVLTKQFDWISGPDLAQQVLPWFEEQARQIHHSRFPMWDTHSWGGQPLLGQAQPGAAYPLNWLMFLVPRRNGHILKETLQWYYVLLHYIAALFCYLLCRDLGRGRAASLIASLVFALTGYIGRADGPQMLNGAMWAPMVILFVLRAGRGVKPLSSAALAGLCLGMSWLSGHHEAPIYLTLTIGGLWLYYIFRNRRPDWRIVKLAAVAMVLSVLIGALQILPAREYGQLSLRWASDSLSSDRNQVLYGWSLFGVVLPGLHRNSDPFMGVTALTLMLLGVAFCWKQPLVKVFFAIALGGLFYSVIPWVQKAQAPSRAIFIFQLGAAALAAYGVDHFLTGEQTWVRRAVAGLSAIGLGAFTILFGVMAARKLVWDTDDRVFITALVTLLLATLLHTWRNGNLSASAGKVLLALLIIQETGNETTHYLSERASKDRFLASSTGNKDIAEYLHGQPGVFRVDSLTDDLVGNWGDYYDIDFFHSYLAGATADNFKLDHGSWQNLSLFGVRYMIGHKPSHESQVEAFEAQSGLKVYLNPRAFPRAWVVHEIIPIRTPEEGASLMVDRLEELRTKAVMSAPPPKLEACEEKGWVLFTRREPSRISLKAAMSCDGMLVLSDTFYPGWRATVDGVPVEIHQVNVAMRGVVVPRGVHEVVFRYRPRSVMAGVALTLSGIAAVALLVLAGRRRDG